MEVWMLFPPANDDECRLTGNHIYNLHSSSQPMKFQITIRS